ncbi:alpha/beta fold hydrolase, partial [Streptomyces griseoaurantiacus]|uniref:alpha/beta fold hydrolase n=1 Tax=Streptomyces griseoaurantiacus TaxID=68213 RepID=UPI00346FB195
FEGSTASGSATFSLVIDAFSMIGSYTERFTVPTLLDDGHDNRTLLARRKLSMPVLAVGTTHSGTSLAEFLAPHADNVQGAVAPTGHFVAEEDPDWFLTTLTDFLS